MLAGDYDSIKSLPLPQLLSLLTETKAPFFYGDDESVAQFKPNQSQQLQEQNLHLINESFPHSKFNYSTLNEANNLYLDNLYENFMWSKFVKDSNDNNLSDKEEELKDDLLELFQWSIQPPHPVVYKDIAKKESGDDIFYLFFFILMS